MLSKLSLLAVAALCLLVVAAAEPTFTLYTRASVPAGWSRDAPASREAMVDFTIALKQRNLDILDKWFHEVSDPKHANYQDFKTIDEIKDLVSPRPADVEKVMAWLLAAGVHHHSITNFGDAIDVSTKVKHAETLFNTKLYTYTHGETGAKVVRQYGAYSVPHSIKGLVDMVTGLSSFPIPHLSVVRNVTGVTNDYGVIPQTFDHQYQISTSARALLKKNAGKFNGPTQAVIEFQGQNFAPSDLAAYGQGVNEQLQVLPASQIIGPNDPTNPQTESTLDIQMTAGTNTNANNWFWLESGNGWLYQFSVHFFTTTTVPVVNSISYGWWEGDQCSIDQTECSQLGVDSQGYVARVNTEFQKIGLRGISLLAASGDSGANGRTDDGCTVPHLRPSFPGSSPYITAVGATELIDVVDMPSQPSICAAAGLTCVQSGTEQAVSYAISQFASGGGFSDIALQPSYQANAVSAYLNSGIALPGPGYFNKSGRAFPDVAAMGHNVIIVAGGAAQPVGGTSCASPIFAAVISVLNAAQIEKTGKPLGFLNPFLYQMWEAEPATFNDITVGDNKCTEDGCAATCEGYLCTKGWDPVTGLGTPNVAAMLEYMQSSTKKH